MGACPENALRVSVFDPTGNITALVEGPVPVGEQPRAASAVMRRFPSVEQVGFVSLGGATPRLRMAGGEFCGNASMCAAALVRLRGGSGAGPVTLAVSGVRDAVEVRLRREAENAFLASVRMPPALSVAEAVFDREGEAVRLPLVRMEGIAHAIVCPSSPLFALLRDRPAAEDAARRFCAVLGAEALGLLFVEGDGVARRLTPLVTVPGSGTLVWESSCASGSAAVGMALASRSSVPVELELSEPGGVLRVSSDPRTGETRLSGRTTLLGSYEISV